MTEKLPPDVSASTGVRSRWWVVVMILALFGFVALVIYDTFQRYPAIWLYIILLDLHFQISRLGLLVAGVMALLGVYIGIIRKGDVTPLYRSGAYVMAGTMLLEALIGAVMYTQGGRPGQDVHFVYGMASVLALPFFIFVEVTAKKRPAMGSYIWGFTLLAGIILRSIVTGS